MVAAPETQSDVAPRDEGRVYWHVGGGKVAYKPVRTGADAVKTFESIPSIDVSKTLSPILAERQALAAQVREAASNVGFFYAVNAPIDTKLMDGAFDAMREFYALPMEEKRKISITKSPAARGFLGGNETRLDKMSKGDDHESWIMGDDYHDEEQSFIREPVEGSKPMNQWPSPALVPHFRKQINDYYIATYNFARGLVRIYALALGLEETSLDAVFKYPIVGMNCLYYPPTEPGHVGLAGHSDFSLFTFVLQEDVSGLEVLNDNAVWVPAPAKKHAWVVNVGDYLQSISNGLFRSTVHRVMNKSGDARYSLPLFFSPDPDCTVGPHPSLVPKGTDPLFEPIVVGQRYVQRTLTSREFHPTALLVREKGLTEADMSYKILQGVLSV